MKAERPKTSSIPWAIPSQKRENGIKGVKRNEDVRILKLAVGIYIIIFTAKLAVYFATNVIVLLAEALHTLSDIFISIFLLVIGTLFILWGYPIADPIAAIVVATIIALNAVGLFREHLNFLLGSSPGPEFFAEVESTARSIEGVLGGPRRESRVHRT